MILTYSLLPDNKIVFVPYFVICRLIILSLFVLYNFRNLEELLLFLMRLGKSTLYCTFELVLWVLISQYCWLNSLILICHNFHNFFVDAQISYICIHFAVCFLDQHMKLLLKSCIRHSKTIKGSASPNCLVVTSQFAITRVM